MNEIDIIKANLYRSSDPGELFRSVGEVMETGVLLTKWRPFIIRIIVPFVLTIILCLISIFLIIIPAFEHSLLSGKRSMIRELTASAWSIVDNYADQVEEGSITREEATQLALHHLRNLRYGNNKRDYFWVTDLKPKMLSHPFRPDLVGVNLSDYSDPDGKRLFADAVSIAKNRGSGYLNYIWEDKQDPDKMVPKLSYVRLFEPWGWIIGTGIYLEDVERESSGLTRKLMWGSLLVTVIIGLILLFMARESLKIEAVRQQQERSLQESTEKYRNLVESSTEGMLMILDGAIVYSNKLFCDLTGYSDDELLMSPLQDLISDPQGEESAEELSARLLSAKTMQKDEVHFQRKVGPSFDGLISISPIKLGGKDGHVITISDIMDVKQTEDELGKSKAQFEHLINNINVGVFRTTVGKQSRFIEANPACITIFGLASEEELFSVPAWDLFLDAADRTTFLRKFSQDGFVKHYQTRMHHRNGKLVNVSISAVLIRDESGKPIYCDGFIEDITEDFRLEEAQRHLVSEMMQSAAHLEMPLSRLAGEKVSSLPAESDYATAIKIVTEEQSNFAILNDPKSGLPAGVISRQKLSSEFQASRDGANQLPLHALAEKILWAEPEMSVAQGRTLILEHGASCLALKDNNNRVKQLISSKRFISNTRSPHGMIIDEVREISDPEQLSSVAARIRDMVLVSGAENIDHQVAVTAISEIGEIVIEKCIELATRALGPAPVNYAFISLGSVGRWEQTMVTDQDNAIIYEDAAPEIKGNVERYFSELSTMVCTWLDKAGYDFCEGEIMAMNPKWRQPLSQWKAYFKQWVSTLEPTDLLETKIFFDFKGVTGEMALVESLKAEMHRLVAQKPLFLFHLVHNCMQFKPPLGIFKNFLVESSGKYKNSLDIKKAMTPVVDFARVYGLKHGLGETGTIDRLTRLAENGALSSNELKELKTLYNYLLELRVKNQARAIENGLVPNNFINPKTLTEMEQSYLREGLIQISSFQAKMSFDFTGSA